MDFAELPAFTKRIIELLDDESYTALQIELIGRPDSGKLIVHGGGLRKIRWAATGSGKRGGVRVIYYWQTAAGRIVMASIYRKNEKENLIPAEVAALRREIGI